MMMMITMMMTMVMMWRLMMVMMVADDDDNVFALAHRGCCKMFWIRPTLHDLALSKVVQHLRDRTFSLVHNKLSSIVPHTIL